jgi:DegV family protein with EDD domain
VPDIRLVTDSTSDLPAELVERHGILVVPAVFVIDGQAHQDGIDIARADFYDRLPGLKELPKTAAPATGAFEAVYRQCGGAEIISFHVASQFSGLFNAARLAAEAFGRQVHLIDSGQVSMGLGWQVLAAAEAVAASKPIAAVLAAAETARRRVKLFAVLDTVEYLRRGGRASALAASLSALLQIKLMLEVAEGKLMPVARLRTHGRAIEKLVEMVEALGPLERLAVLHAHSLEAARQLAERLAARAMQPPLIVEVTTVIGTHAGPGALGVAAVTATGR